MNATPTLPHPQVDLIEQFFAGELPGEQWEPLLRHVDTCESCRARFETTRVAFRSLGGDPARPDSAVLGRSDAELIGRLLLAPPPRPPRSRPLLWGGLVSAAALAGVVLVFLAPGRPDQPAMSERGDPAASRPAFDVLCLSADDAAKAISSRASGGSCRPDSFLKVTVTVPAGDLRQATVLAVDPSWRLRFVTRAAVSGQAAQILPGHAQLARGEHLFFFAAFSARAIDQETVQRAIDGARV